MFEFGLPWLGLLLPLPWLVYQILPRREHQHTAIQVPYFKTLQAMQENTPNVKRGDLLRKVLLLLIWVGVLAAAAQPRWVGDPVSLPTSGRDLLLAVDISGSMEAADMIIEDDAIQRIDAVKFVVTDFIDRRSSDRLGLILFGSQAYLQAPLTFDRETVGTFLQEAQLGFAGQQTAIGDAIGIAVKRLQARPASSRVLILLTDGANTAGEVDPRQAADLAKLADVKIYTVGVGADEMLQRTFFGTRKINPSADLDEETLQYISKQTGGQYFRARDPKELIQIYQQLDLLEPIEQDNEFYRPTKALYFWPLGIAFFASLVMALGFVSWQYRRAVT